MANCQAIECIHHRSSRRPRWNGCRTFPSADFARYSVSASSFGSTQMPLCAIRFVYGCVPDQRHQFLLEVSGGRLVKSVVELARIDQIVAVAAIDIDAVPFSLVESAIVSVSRWMQVFFTQSPVRPFG